MRGSRWLAPTEPHTASGQRKVARVEAMMKSQAVAISQPDPMTGPCATAMQGFSHHWIAL
jgi:hypothetical protein